MRVSQSGNNQVQSTETSSAKRTGKAEGKVPNRQAEGTSGAGGGDSVKADLSAKGREFARAKEVATNAPDTREEKIAELKRRIAEGRYNVKPDAVADKLVDEHLKMSGMS